MPWPYMYTHALSLRVRRCLTKVQCVLTAAAYPGGPAPVYSLSSPRRPCTTAAPHNAGSRVLQHDARLDSPPFLVPY